LGSVGAGSEERNGRAGFAVDGQLVAADVDSVDQEAEVVLRERLVRAEEEVADCLLESGDRRLGVQVARWRGGAVRGTTLAKGRRELVAASLKLPEARQHHIGRVDVGLECFPPSCDAALHVSKLLPDLVTLLVGVATQQPRFFDNLADDGSATLDGENAIGQVLEERAVQLFYRSVSVSVS